MLLGLLDYLGLEPTTVEHPSDYSSCNGPGYVTLVLTQTLSRRPSVIKSVIKRITLTCIERWRWRWEELECGHVAMLVIPALADDRP